jgi:ribosomal-protein-alanine N-acetyltransferase
MTSRGNVETLRTADIEIVAKIHATCFFDSWGPSIISQVLDMPGTFGLVARRQNYSSIVGFALARIAADECELLSLGVASEYRANGAGTRLLTAAMARAVSEQARWFFLEVAEDNKAALHMYGTHGLTKVGYRLNYYENADGSKTNALTMRCALPDLA